MLLVLYIDGLVHERRNPSALAMELRISCTNPSVSEFKSFIFNIKSMSFIKQAQNSVK